MKYLILMAVAIASIACAEGKSIEGETRADVFNRNASLSGKFSVKWTVDTASKMVTFDLTVNTTGYIGFGISDNANMTNADLIIAGVDGNRTYFTVR
jgi:hypothetical protein